ncbi:MAG: hypothetical protein GX442_14245 [Candidatus Riflebacteria bacterium]|nr:hypothetical protein [Candidatus Riflebacteria bacterium]
MPILRKCRSCGNLILAGGLWDRDEPFCCVGCRNTARGKPTELCPACRQEASGEGFTGSTAISGFGTILLGGDASCRHCGSVVMTEWLVLLLPLVPLKSFRVLPVKPQVVSGRRIPLHRPHLVRFYGGIALMALCGGSIGWSPVFFVLLILLVVLFPFVIFLW